MRALWAFAIAGGLFCSACGGGGRSTDRDAGNPTDGSPATDGAVGAGRHDHRLMVEGVERQVIVHVPASVVGTSAPAVVVVHGTGQDGELFYRTSRWVQTADASGLVVAFVTGLTWCYREDQNNDGDFTDPGDIRVTTKWTEGWLGDPMYRPLCNAAEVAALNPTQRALVNHPTVEDLNYIDATLALLTSTYRVDARRIYATGFSNGGAFTARLGLERANRFAAVASASGPLRAMPRAASRPLSAVTSLGSLEGGLPLDTSVMNNARFREQYVDPLRTVLQLSDRYQHEVLTVAGRRVSQFTFSTSTVGASNQLQILIVEGLDHAYPNGNNHPVVLAQALSRFFTGYALP